MQLAMLGAVILLMRQVTQPASVAFLGQLFGNPRSQRGDMAPDGKGVAITPVDADGKVAFVKTGYSPDGAEKLAEQVRKLLKP